MVWVREETTKTYETMPVWDNERGLPLPVDVPPKGNCLERLTTMLLGDGGASNDGVFSFRLHQEIEKTPVWPDSFDKTISG
jgi:hypothetical protein